MRGVRTSTSLLTPLTDEQVDTCGDFIQSLQDEG